MRINNMNDLGKFLQPKIRKALENVTIQLVNELKNYISNDIYEQNKDRLSINILSALENIKYNIKSVPSGAKSQIFIENDIFSNLKDENNRDITLNTTTLNDFTNYCNNNYARLFKQEMKKLGVPLR